MTDTTHTTGTLARIEHLVTSGKFSLDGDEWDVDNNVWIIGDDTTVIVIDPSHDARAIAAAVGGREVAAILLSHGHDDHIRAVGEFVRTNGAPVYLNSNDRMLWNDVYPMLAPDHDIREGDTFTVADVTLTARHTPGHSPGSVSFYSAELGTVFTGDTLFQGGPGATGRLYSSFDTIIESITTQLLTLPAETVVRTGHGDTTTIGAEAPQRDEWIARGH
ncbi:MBL fold metallo-hydrolase [Klugiella xanthotipulae]|uniref:Glyoxylase-like metal-dependent hydrolase (Beta-lactamase superfamily II) n=1 Tax=Klugiella xanthotipulae TaxID=244735 RepID=A0A543I711_9MICO|nr:MBL fold metallo-hydrolase [Klugiella xanthotipulae]TQM66367.1 glyoxylase-like metal-dependent hydrolase (beta-lactamase superfamily II) [Klugiella xanthotipulae]